MGKNDEKEKNGQKYIVLDVVFHASSLNYDWGGGTNYQELKKITKWDGRQYAMVSRYALRYSILHWGNKLFPDRWKLAGPGQLHAEKGDVVRLEEVKKEIFENYPEFDLFGFMIAKKGSNEAATTRVSPVKISHAISLTPLNMDVHTMANLDIMKRAGSSGSNPVTIEEKMDFYIYNITIDVNRIGKYLKNEHGDENIGDIEIEENKAKQRIVDLIDAVLNLKRDIKGRREDLSPWLVVVGKYNDGRYESFADKIRLDRKTHYKVKRKYSKDGDDKNGQVDIEEEIEEGLLPTFHIDAREIDINNKPMIYFREGFCDYDLKDKFETKKSKKEILNNIRGFLGLSTEKPQ